jgi:hypothetical protein
MAKIVLGIGTSHTPLLSLEGHEWGQRAEADRQSTTLNLTDGRWVTYDQLRAEVGEPYAQAVTPEVFQHKSDICQKALDRLANEIEAAAPDVVVIVGDDQEELYSPKNIPALAVFYGEEVVMHAHRFMAAATAPAWAQKVSRGWAVDAKHRFPGARAFGLELIAGLLDRDVDVGACAEVEDPDKAGFGHAFGFVVTRLFRRPIPIVPILLNTYYPPNVLSAARCYDVGRALAEVINGSPSDFRVAIVASGGLSHFVVDEDLDKAVLGAIENSDTAYLRGLPRPALNAGSSEILNWVMAAGALADVPVKSIEYCPLQRTPAGTGVGAAFVVWADASGS